MKYRVRYKSVGYFYLDVEANSIEEAKEIAENTDGGEFTEDGIGEWNYDRIKDSDGSIKNAKFTSVWDNGLEITTNCKVNTRTKEIFDIERARVDSETLGTLDKEFVTIDNTKYLAGSATSETEGWNPDKDYWYK